MTEPTVTQADRERAASIAVLTEMRELILAGRADHHAVPFARWREADLAEGVEMGIEAAASRCDISAAVYAAVALDPKVAGIPSEVRRCREGAIALDKASETIRNLSPATIIAQHKREADA